MKIKSFPNKDDVTDLTDDESYQAEKMMKCHYCGSVDKWQVFTGMYWTGIRCTCRHTGRISCIHSG